MKKFVVLTALLVLALPAVASAAPVLWQVDTFQDLTTDGWFAGGLGFGSTPPVPPHVVATGGPAGAGDAFLEVAAQGGNGPGSRLVAINASQWAGDYLGAGIGAIAMDLINLGVTDLTIRLLFEDPMGGPPIHRAVTTAGALLPVGSGWMHVLFPISAADLLLLQGPPGSENVLLANTTLLRIIHAPVAGDAEPVAGLLGVDNISAAAAAVPEPTTLLLLGIGITAVSRRLGSRA